MLCQVNAFYFLFSFKYKNHYNHHGEYSVAWHHRTKNPCWPSTWLLFTFQTRVSRTEYTINNVIITIIIIKKKRKETALVRGFALSAEISNDALLNSSIPPPSVIPFSPFANTSYILFFFSCAFRFPPFLLAAN